MNDNVLYLEALLAGHLPHHTDLDGRGILLIVNGKQGYTPFVLSNNINFGKLCASIIIQNRIKNTTFGKL